MGFYSGMVSLKGWVRWAYRRLTGEADEALRRETARLDAEISRLRHDLDALRNELRARLSVTPQDIAAQVQVVAEQQTQAVAALWADAATALEAAQSVEARQARAIAVRLEKLELVATEHPDIAAATAPYPAFPSPAVTIITPTWNRARLVGAAVRSVQAQHFTDWEMIVVDDGSTDDTAGAMASFAGDRRVRYVRKDHAGQCAARNHALGLANGALIAYLDSDNIWFPGYLAAAVATFATRPEVDCAYGAMVTESHGKDRRILFEPFDRRRLVAGNFIGMSTFIHRRAMFERLGGFDETLTSLEDWDLILRYTAHAPACRLPFLAVRYRNIDNIRVSATQGGAIMDRDQARIQAKWTD